jgi:putative ABC transport system permease protein
MVGVAIAYVGVRWFAGVVPNFVPIYGDITLDRSVLAFAALVTLGTGLLFGVAPAWQASRAQLQETLTLRGEAASSARLGARSALVMGQIALCVVLLVSAALLTRSLVALARVNPGFDPDHLLTLQFRLPPTKYDSETKIADMFTRAIAEIRGVPGVQSAALVRATPLNGNGENFPYEIAEGTSTEPEKLPTAHRNIISSDYFTTVRIPRLAGRDFTPEDRNGSAPVVIVNEQLARRIAPTGSAIGRRIRILEGDELVWRTIVGVVGNAKHFQLNEATLDQVYIPYTQRPLIFTEIVVRTAADPMGVANAVRSAIWRVDRDQPVWRVRPVTQSIEGALGARKFTMRLLGAFAVVAVILAIIGVYGVMAYAVAERTHELGVRLALGATAADVLRLVLVEAIALAAIGVAVGIAGALATTRLMAALLFGVAPTDLATFAALSAVLVGTALAASYIPARRATRVDPMVALRYE